MAVALVNPPYQRAIEAIAQTTVGPPMGLCYLAGALRAAGIEVSILDANALELSVEQTVAATPWRTAELIGLTATTPTLSLCGAIARGLRAAGFTGTLALGGPHASALPEQTLDGEPALDVVVIGEGEQSLVELVRAQREGRDLLEVPGLAVRVEGVARRSPDRVYSVPIDDLPAPARDLLPLDRYLSPDGNRTMTVIASRGCPAPCTYCAVPRQFGRKLRRRDPEQVADEVRALADDLDVRWVDFIDDTFTWDRKWALALCAALVDRGLHRRVNWLCLTRVDRVDPELLATMAAAGCKRVEMGIECASDQGLATLRKGIDEQQVIDAFRWAHAAGLETLAFAMVNVPGETLADIEATGRLLTRARPDYLQLTYCTPYPGTPLYVQSLAQGRLRTRDFDRFRFLRDVVLDNGVLREDEVRRAHRRLQRAFWLRPRVAWKMGRRLLTESGSRLATLRMAGKALRHL